MIDEPCSACVILVKELEKRIDKQFVDIERHRKELADLMNERLNDHNIDRQDFVRVSAYNELHKAVETKINALATESTALRIQLSNIKTAVYVVIGIMASSVLVGILRWAIK